MPLYPVIVNFLGFQVGWFACVLSAANDQPLLGVIITSVIIGFHIFQAKSKAETLLLLSLVTLLGSTWDSLLTSQGILVFDTGTISSFLAPYWIVVMWTLFATTLSISLRWLFGHYFYAMILGAVSGPLVYQAGSALGAVAIPDMFSANILLAIGWSMVLPAAILLAEIIEKTPLAKVDTK